MVRVIVDYVYLENGVAKDIVTIFVGYNLLQTKVLRDMLNDISDEKFITYILETIPPAEGVTV